MIETKYFCWTIYTKDDRRIDFTSNLALSERQVRRRLYNEGYRRSNILKAIPCDDNWNKK